LTFPAPDNGQTRSWHDALATYTRPRVVGMVFLGFAAGLPFLLVFTTLSAWLAKAGIDRTTIGFFSWIGITYSIKFFWAPVVDRAPLPPFTRILGKRRGWMLAAQLTIAIGLTGMALTDPGTGLGNMVLFALLVAFGSATQDITVDAYRIEAVDQRLQGAMAATYVLGYRIALLTAGAGALHLANISSWTLAYLVMAGLMGVGMLTTLIIREPEHRIDSRTQALEARLESTIGIHDKAGMGTRLAAWFSDAVVSPFVEFFQRNGKTAVLILLLVGCYKLSDITMGVMANPFYIDLGFGLDDIANVTKLFGFFMTIAGAALGGVLVVRYGILRPLLAGAILIASTNLLFVWLASSEPTLVSLAIVVSADNLSGGFATSAFIAYLSSLTNTAYTATQYALFSSLMTLPAKFIGGFAGVVVDTAGYASFFLYAGLLGLPAILLVLVILNRDTGAAQPAR
jgi:PAT family beta-lactamase induction signal transducer AmpG